MTRALAVFFLAILLFTSNIFATSLTILYTNDIHSRLERLESLSSLIAQERAKSDSVLLFDVGDAWHDFRVPIYAVWGASETATWMNQIEYDAMALGNHEMYWGAERLASLSASLNFPLLCANLRSTFHTTTPFSPYTCILVGDLQVLVVGLIGPGLLPYQDFPWLHYEQPEKVLEDLLIQEGSTADLVIVLGHLSVGEASRIAQAIPDIDVFLTGHSHEITPEPVKVGQTLVLQAGAFGHFLGRLQLEINPSTGRIASADNTLLPTEETPISAEEGWTRLLKVAVLIAGLLSLLFF